MIQVYQNTENDIIKLRKYRTRHTRQYLIATNDSCVMMQTRVCSEFGPE